MFFSSNEVTSKDFNFGPLGGEMNSLAAWVETFSLFFILTIKNPWTSFQSYLPYHCFILILPVNFQGSLIFLGSSQLLWISL